MEDEKIKMLLGKYMEKEMDLIIPEEMEGFEHTFSKRFDRHMRQVMLGEKYLGRNIRFMRPIRYAAIFAVAITGILMAGTVGNRIINSQLWKNITSYQLDNQIEGDIYPSKEDDTQTSQPEAQAEVKKEIPSYVPEGMEQKDVQETSILINVEWEGGKDKHISYTRTVIVENLKSSTDVEYQSKKSIVIAGHKGFLYRKNDGIWIDWDDTKYNHNISSIGIEDENELIKMGESLYEAGITKK